MISRPDLTYKEVLVELGSIWNKLDDEQKAPFQAQNQQLMVEWRKAMDAYNLGGHVEKEDCKGDDGDTDIGYSQGGRVEEGAEAGEEVRLGEK